MLLGRGRRACAPTTMSGCHHFAPVEQRSKNVYVERRNRRLITHLLIWPGNVNRKSTHRLFNALLAAFSVFGYVSLGSSAGITAVDERPLLLYIPMHVSEPLEHLQELCDNTLSKNPWLHNGNDENQNYDIAFDILLVISGPKESSRNATERFDNMRLMLENATKTILHVPPRIFLDYKTTVGVDKYTLNLAEEDKDAEWVSGPNSVFYDAMAEGGEIYEKYVRFYALVQQLETDMAALRDGWLSALMRPMLTDVNNLVIMSGSTIKSSCMYIVKYDECQAFEEDSRHMTEHINGNAVYRTGEMFQQLLKASREQFKNFEPFDLAMHHVLKASNATDLVHSNPLYHNTATLLDRDWFMDVRYHGVDDLAVVHAPRRLRADGLKAVATRAQSYLPATTVVLSKESTFGSKSSSSSFSSLSSTSSSRTLLRNFKAAADAVRLSGVIYVATSEDVFFEASRVVPLQVFPAFEQRRRGGDGGATDEDDDDDAADADAAATASVDPKSLVLTWPPTSPSPSMRLLSTITQLVTNGYSPLVVEPSSAPLQNYDIVLNGFPKDAVYFVDTMPLVQDERRRPFDEVTQQEGGSSTVAVETMFIPASAYTTNLLQAWAMTMSQREARTQQKQQLKSPPVHLTLAEVRALAACRLETTMSGFTPCPWRGVGVETLPIHWFPPQAAFFGSGWTKRARKRAFFLDMSSGRGGGGGDVNDSDIAGSSRATKNVERTSTIFRLRHAGKWHSPARCPTYSVLSRLPRDLTHETVLKELEIHAEFLSFVRENKIACAVLPGFRIPSTSATLPVDVLLDLGTIQASAGSQAAILPRVQDVKDASVGYVAFDVLRGRRRGGERETKTGEAASVPQHSRREPLPPTTTLSPLGDDICLRFDSIDLPSSPASSSSHTFCLAKDISRALEEARSRISSSSKSYVCALDPQRSVEEVALAGLRVSRGLAEVTSTIARNVRGSKTQSTILLTGAWRLLPRGSFSSTRDNLNTTSLNILTLSDLHSHDQRLQNTQELNPKASPLVDEAWAAIVEALLCFDGRDSGGNDYSVDLSWQQRRSKATSMRHKSKIINFAELVAKHIPPFVLLEDVTAFTKWLARPDRPKLVSGRSLQLFIDDSHHHRNQHEAALDALEMIAPALAETKADFAFLPTAADSTTGALLPWSSVTDIGDLYRARPSLLPPSLAAMMHPSAVLEFLRSPGSSTLPLVLKGKESSSGTFADNNHADDDDDDDDDDDIALGTISQNAAFRTTVAALVKRSRMSTSMSPIRKKKMWLLPSVGPRSRDTTSVSSMGAGDDVVVRVI